MSRKIAKKAERNLRVKRAILIYGVIPVVGALVLPLALGSTSIATGSNIRAQESLYALAASDAQRFVTSSSIVSKPLERGSYSATTPEEIAAKKAAEEAAAEEVKRKEEEARIQAQAASLSFSPKLNYAMVAPGSGAIRWPLPEGSWKLGERLGAGRGHQGVDFIAAEGTPIYAAAAGTVKVAQNGYSGYGTAVELVHSIDGNQIETLYGHMPVSSFAVNVGDRVEAGQLIGYVGNTGRSFGSHLHLEVRLNGSIIDGYDWLSANAG